MKPAHGGRLVGRYVVHDRIAAGGMATVHLGRLLGAAGFSRTVAIKRLHDAYAQDTDFVAMLLDEARIAAMIRHPNVVPTLDVVAEQDELLVVMEYVEGDSVAHLVKLIAEAGTRVPAVFAASIVAQALHGLHAAHEACDKNGEPLLIVHRDVSPQNILVGVDGVARVLDFGIAKAASRATSTEDGVVKGKTAYMAPEQLEHGAVDRRTDVFAAAVVLWELLTGRRLFFADSPSEIMSRVLTMPIPSPSLHAPGLPPALAAVTLRGLARDPNQRFATAEAMANAIEEAITLPRAKDVGAWVATMAKGTLESRRALVKVVEQSSHKMPAAPPTGDSSPPVNGLARAIAEAERRREHAELPTDVGQAAPAQPPMPAMRTDFGRLPAPRTEESTELATVQSTIHPTRTRPTGSRVPLVLAIGGGLALVLALGVAGFSLRASRQAPVEQASARSASPPVAAVTLPEPVHDAGIVTEPASPVPPVLPAVKGATGMSTAVTKNQGSKGSGVRPTGRPPVVNPCEIPFVIDDKGLKHFKPECVP